MVSECAACGRSPKRVCGRNDCPQRVVQVRHEVTGNTAWIPVNELAAMGAPSWRFVIDDV